MRNSARFVTGSPNAAFRFSSSVSPNKQTIYGQYLFSGRVAAPETRLDALLRN